MLGALTIAAIGMGAVDLSTALLGLRGTAPRLALTMATMLLYVGVYWGLYIACVWAGTPMGLLLTGVPAMAAGTGVPGSPATVFADQLPVFTLDA